MTEKAYIVDLPFQENSYIDGNFKGGDESIKCLTSPDDRPNQAASLRDCLMLKRRAPDLLVSAAPTQLFLNRKYKKLPDFGLGPWGGIELASDRFVEIAERLDPGRHQFIQIAETYDRSGVKIDKSYYIMNIYTTINAVNVEKSNVKIIEREIKSTIDSRIIRFLSMKKLDPFKIVIDRDKISDINIWWGSSNDIYKMFFSEKLLTEMKRSGISPLRYTPVDVM